MHVDDVAPVLGDFDPVAHFEGPAPHEERPSGEIRERIFQRNRDSSRDEAEKRGDGREPFEPFATDDQHRDGEEQIRNALAPAIAGPGVGEAAVDDGEHDALEQPQARDHDDRDQQVHLHGRTQSDTSL